MRLDNKELSDIYHRIASSKTSRLSEIFPQSKLGAFQKLASCKCRPHPNMIEVRRSGDPTEGLFSRGGYHRPSSRPLASRRDHLCLLAIVSKN